MKPEAAMRLALSQARQGLGRTFPNPSVGAVVFRGEQVLARGRTQPPGGRHAEVVALETARKRHGARALRGAAMAVTLEPCCHVGRTGPCTDAIIEAGIGRVYVGCRDPHALVSRRSVGRLRAAGIAVEVGVLEAACREQHRGFLSVCERGRPWITLKLATTLDARIATAHGESRWITGAASRAFVHALRARVDAVAVGSGTALADDPALTARKGGRVVHRPVRVLVDSSLRVPSSAQLFSGNGPTWVLCRRDARGIAARERRGAIVLPTRRRGAHLDLVAGFERLADEGLTHVLVEGGGQLAAALLRRELVDELHWIQAPRLLGDDGRPALGALAVRKLADAPRLDLRRVRRLGDDLHVHALVAPAPTG